MSLSVKTLQERNSAKPSIFMKNPQGFHQHLHLCWINCLLLIFSNHGLWLLLLLLPEHLEQPPSLEDKEESAHHSRQCEWYHKAWQVRTWISPSGGSCISLAFGNWFCFFFLGYITNITSNIKVGAKCNHSSSLRNIMALPLISIVS